MTAKLLSSIVASEEVLLTLQRDKLHIERVNLLNILK